MIDQRPSEERLLDALRLRHVASASELGQALGLSQPSVSRALATAGERVVRIGQARRTRYAATRQVRGLGDRWPLYRIDADGRPQAFGQLIALHGDGSVVETAQPTDWLRDEFGEGLFPGLPWFLDDMRPQGFLGRLFAQRCAPELGLDPNVLRWNEDAVLTALLLRGQDGPGNFVLGQQALDHALGAIPTTIHSRARAERYAALAQATLAGESVGSSAAGEQPKFTACVDGVDGTPRHVIVKFSDRIQGNPTSRRWADLLICEHLANQVLGEAGHASAQSELVWTDDQLFLESTRSDRSGLHGRRGFVSLAAWSDAHDGTRDSWAQAAARMHDVGWINTVSVDEITQRWWFGRMIGNTDMHFGNLGFFLDDSLPLALCPSYDMLPMLYRPAANGSIVARDYQPPTPVPATLSHWHKASTCADAFWRRASDHAKISADFRHLANDNLVKLGRLRARFA